MSPFVLWLGGGEVKCGTPWHCILVVYSCISLYAALGAVVNCPDYPPYLSDGRCDWLQLCPQGWWHKVKYTKHKSVTFAPLVATKFVVLRKALILYLFLLQNPTQPTFRAMAIKSCGQDKIIFPLYFVYFSKV